MAKKFLTPIDLLLNELRNAVIQQLAADPSSPTDGQIWVNTTQSVLKLKLGGTIFSFGRLEQLNAPAGPLALNGQRITGMADGSSANDAATVGQVTASTAGLDVKASVRALAQTNISTVNPGATIDGVALAAGDRILLIGQTAASENGIYTWSGPIATLVRALDADASGEVTAGMFTFVEEGSVNADSGWVLTTNAPIVLGTTPLVFAKFSAASAGAKKYAITGPPSNNTTWMVLHSMGMTDVICQVFDSGTSAMVECDVTIVDGNNVRLDFAATVTSGALRVVIVG
jgi:hypothetical protein